MAVNRHHEPELNMLKGALEQDMADWVAIFRRQVPKEKFFLEDGKELAKYLFIDDYGIRDPLTITLAEKCEAAGVTVDWVRSTLLKVGEPDTLEQFLDPMPGPKTLSGKTLRSRRARFMAFEYLMREKHDKGCDVCKFPRNRHLKIRRAFHEQFCVRVRRYNENLQEPAEITEFAEA